PRDLGLAARAVPEGRRAIGLGSDLPQEDLEPDPQLGRQADRARRARFAAEPAQVLEVVPQLVAGQAVPEVALELDAQVARQRAVGVLGEGPDAVVALHGASPRKKGRRRSRRRNRARCRWTRTVPGSRPRISPVSSVLRPSISRSSNTARWSGVRVATAASRARRASVSESSSSGGRAQEGVRASLTSSGPISAGS